jgi:hypothetical protein
MPMAFLFISSHFIRNHSSSTPVLNKIIVTTQLTGGGGVQKMMKPFFEHRPSRVPE